MKMIFYIVRIQECNELKDWHGYIYSHSSKFLVLIPYCHMYLLAGIIVTPLYLYQL